MWYYYPDYYSSTAVASSQKCWHVLQYHLYWMSLCVFQVIKSPYWTRAPSSPKPTLRESSGRFAKSEAPLWNSGRCSAFKVRRRHTFPQVALNHHTCRHSSSVTCCKDTRTWHTPLRHATNSKSARADKGPAVTGVGKLLLRLPNEAPSCFWFWLAGEQTTCCSSREMSSPKINQGPARHNACHSRRAIVGSRGETDTAVCWL